MSHIVLGTSGDRNASLDIDVLLRTRMLVQANSGKGKSFLLRRMAEQFFGKVQVILIDPEGEFATLREKYGYVLVGKGGETPADPRSAALVAHKLLELRASAVCDLYEMKPFSRHEWVKNFAEAMIDAPKNLWHPCIIIGDELHTFCPEKGSGESVASEAIVGLGTRGRKRGYALIAATQRLGKLRKDLAAELLNVLIGGTFIDIDRKRAADALGVYGKDQHQFFDEIKLLERGSFYALGPAISDERILIKVGPVETTHPEAGSSKHAAEPPPAPDKVKAMLPKLADLPKTAEEKARTEGELRKEIRELKTQLRTAPTATKEQDPKAIERHVRAAIADKQREIAGLERRIATFKKTLESIARSAAAELGRVYEPLKASGVEIQKGDRTASRVLGKNAPLLPISRPKEIQEVDVQLKAGARKMLTILAQWHPESKTRDEIGALAGFAPTGGTFSDYLSKLRMAAFISENGHGMNITEEGLQFVGDIPPRPDSTEELVYMWKSKFKAGVGKMLDVLVESHPHTMTREELGERSGFTASGGTFSDYLSQLRRARLIEEPGGNVKAAESLFP